MHSFDDIYLVTNIVKVASEADVDAAEAILGTSFPVGYREYATKLGQGEFCGFVHIYDPLIIARNQTTPTMLSEYKDLWEDGRNVLPQDKLCECIVIGSSIDGDMIAFHPDDPNTLYELPRHDSTVFLIGSTLYEALDWYRTTRLRSQPAFFDAGKNRTTYTPLYPNVSYKEFRDWLMELGRYNIMHEGVSASSAKPSVTISLLEDGKLIKAGQPDERYLSIFYKCFSGYLICYTDMFSRLSAQVYYDAGKDDGTAQQIVAYLKSKKA